MSISASLNDAQSAPIGPAPLGFVALLIVTFALGYWTGAVPGTALTTGATDADAAVSQPLASEDWHGNVRRSHWR